MPLFETGKPGSRNSSLGLATMEGNHLSPDTEEEEEAESAFVLSSLCVGQLACWFSISIIITVSYFSVPISRYRKPLSKMPYHCGLPT